MIHEISLIDKKFEELTLDDFYLIYKTMPKKVLLKDILSRAADIESTLGLPEMDAKAAVFVSLSLKDFHNEVKYFEDSRAGRLEELNKLRSKNSRKES